MKRMLRTLPVWAALTFGLLWPTTVDSQQAVITRLDSLRVQGVAITDANLTLEPGVIVMSADSLAFAIDSNNNQATAKFIIGTNSNAPASWIPLFTLSETGVITVAEWQGTIIDEAYLDADLLTTANNLEDLNDVSLYTPDDDDVLQWDTGEWTAKSLAMAGISVPGHTHVKTDITNTPWAWADVSKTGSSLADLATRSASDLSSGTLLSARLSGSYTGITGVGTLSAGTWQATVIDETYLDADLINSTELNAWTGSANIVTVGTIGTGTWQGTTIAGAYGGTGHTTYTKGDILYSADGGSALSLLPLGTGDQVLTVVTGVEDSLSWANSPTHTLSELTDVTIAGLADEHHLVYDSGDGRWENAAVSIPDSIEDLGDVSFESLAAGEILLSATSNGGFNWINSTLANAGISATGHTHVWADVSKTGSSLADLATRSAADLSSGILLSARLSGSYTGITGVGILTAGTWQATVIDETYLDADLITNADDLDALADVTYDTVGDDEILLYSSGAWINQTFTEAGLDTLNHTHLEEDVTDLDHYTTADFNTDFGTKSTTDLSEGTNLYWTQARFNTAFTAKSTSDLSEGTNLYYTNARADARIGAASIDALNDVTLDTPANDEMLLYSTGQFINQTFAEAGLSATGHTHAWADVSKTGSSLADLATRSAADLSTGILLSARLSGSYTGITGVGVLAAGTWQGTVIDSAYIDPDFVTTYELNQWTGSTSVTTLGTISAGTWQATVIDEAYLDTDLITNADDLDALADVTYDTPGDDEILLYSSGLWINQTFTEAGLDTLNHTHLEEDITDLDHYTTADFSTDFATKSTTDLSEGTNLYYTAARFNTAFSGKSTTDLSEGTNLYYTDGRVDTRIGATSIDALNDVTLDTPSDDEILQYSTGQFINQTLAEAGIGTSNITLANATNNYVVTATGADALTGEPELTYDGNVLLIDGGELHVTDQAVTASEGLQFQAVGVNANASSRVFFIENVLNTFGFSHIYAGNTNPTLGGVGFTMGANTYEFRRHDNSATGTIVYSVARNSNNMSFTGALTWSGGGSANANTAYSHTSLTNDPHSVTKAQVGLGSVENTALSTWAGTTNLDILGTVATGVWQATAIADAYIATSANWNTAYTHSQSSSNPHSTGVDNLNDTIITGPTENDLLQWNGAAWVDRSLGEAGIGTGSSDVTLANATNNYVVTATGVDALTGEANLRFDGANLEVGATYGGVALYRAVSGIEESAQVFWDEQNQVYGFSGIMAGYVNPTLGGHAYTIATNTFEFRRHNNSAEGTYVYRVSRETGAFTFAGNVGIGIAPSNALDVDGDIAINNTVTNRLILPINNDAVTPTISFGDGNSGFYERVDNEIRMALAGSTYWMWTTSQFAAKNTNGAAMLWETASATNPVLVPHRDDLDTGVGGITGDQLSLIAGGVEGIRIIESAGAIKVGIGTVPLYALNVQPSNDENFMVRDSVAPTGGIMLQSVNDANSIAQPMEYRASVHSFQVGNVGIGTTGPETLFHVAKSNAGGIGGALYLDNFGASTLNNETQIAFGGDAGASFAGVSGARLRTITKNAGSGASSFQIDTWNGSSEAARIYIDETGNVGIGDIDPNFGLDVQVVSRFNNYIYIGGSGASWDVAQFTWAAGQFKIRSESGRDLRLGAGGIDGYVIIDTAGDVTLTDNLSVASGTVTWSGGGSANANTAYTHSQSNSNPHSTGVDNLNDTVITGPSDNDILQWNGSAWVDRTLAEAGIGTGSSDVTLANATNNYVVTATGVDALTGEANLTFDGSTLTFISASDNILRIQSADPGSGSIDFYEGAAEKAHVTFNTSSNLLTMGRAGGDLSIDNSGNVVINSGTLSVSSTINASDGSVGTPAYTFTNDTDTGIYRGGSGEVVVTSNGVRAMWIHGTYWYGKNTSGSPAVRHNIAGTAATPTYAFYSDLDTGMYRSGTNAIGFGLAGVKVVEFTSSGVVTITEDNPVLRLQEKDDNNYDLTFQAVHNASASFIIECVKGTILKHIVNGGEHAYQLGQQIERLVFQTGSTDRVIINSTGKVGIGTNNMGRTLSVNGDAGILNDLYLGAFAPGGGSLRLQETSGDFGINQWDGSAWTTHFYVEAASPGNVGVGTTDPFDSFHVRRQFASAENEEGILRLELYDLDGFDDGSGPLIWFAGGDAASDNNNIASIAGIRAGNDTTGALVFYAGIDGAEEFVRITEDGDVGMGEASPSADLDLLGTNDGINFLVSDLSTNATTKEMRFGLRHYTNAEEPVAIIYGASVSGASSINIGGGTGLMNAVETISFWTAANDITVSGTRRMIIKPSGNVGIGTEGPFSELHVKGSVSAMIQLEDGDGAADEKIRGILSSGGRLILGTRNDDGTFKASHLTILNSGNVGIGTTGPSEILELYDTYPTLAIQRADVGIWNNVSLGGILWRAQDNAPGDPGLQNVAQITVYADNNWGAVDGEEQTRLVFGTLRSRTLGVVEAMRIDSDGYVGINETAPVVELVVQGTGTVANFGTDATGVNVGTSGTVAYVVGVDIDGNAYNDIRLGAGGSANGVTVRTSGNVGINDTTPSYKLDVNGTLRVTGLTTVDAIYAADGIRHDGDTDTYIRFLTDRMFSRVGNVEMFDIIEDGTQDKFRIGFNSDVDVTIGQGGKELFLEGSSGNVGVNDITPSYQLDVNGTLRAVGDMYADDNLIVTSTVTWSGGGSVNANTAYTHSQASGNQHSLDIEDIDDTIITGPTENDLLQWNGSAWVDRSLSEAGVSDLSLATSTNNQVVTVTGANAMTGESGLIFDGTNLGIGTTGPTGLLHIQRSVVSGFDSHDDDIVIVERTGDYSNLNLVSTVGSYLMFSDDVRNRGSIAYFHSDDSMRLHAGGADVITLIGGKVGIGTLGPAGKLTISSDGASLNQFIRLENTESGHVRTWMLGVVTASSGMFRIYDITANADRLLIASSGYIGVGATPNSEFHVNTGTNENLLVRSYSEFGAGYSGLLLNTVNDANSNYVPFGIEGSIVSINTGTTGPVGIGTNEIDGNLDIYDASGNTEVYIKSETDNAYLYLSSNIDLVGGEESGIFFQDQEANSWELYKAADDNFRLYDYNRGATVFEVADGGNMYLMANGGQIAMGGTAIASGAVVHVTSGTDNDFIIGDNPHTTTNATEGISFGAHSNGNVYIDTKVNSGGFLHFRVGSGTSYGYAITALTIDGDNGYVGILDGSPAHPLDVTGTARFTSYISAETDIYLGQYFFHSGDSNTYMRYQNDLINWYAGGVKMLQLYNTTQDWVGIGNIDGGGDIDVNFNSGQVFVEGNTGNVGVNDITPSYKFDVNGTIRTTSYLVLDQIADPGNPGEEGWLYVDSGADPDLVFEYDGQKVNLSNFGALNQIDDVMVRIQVLEQQVTELQATVLQLTGGSK